MSPQPDPTDGLPAPRRYWALLALTITIFMVVIESVIVNVALPTISQDFGVSDSSAVWVVTAYQLTVAVSLFPFAALGERFGYFKVYGFGLIVFTLASLLCAEATGLWSLVAARAIQGIGASAVMGVNLALVRFILPRHLLGRGVGYITLVVALSATAGPTIAAGVMTVATWPWLFLIKVPIGLVALPIALASLPRTPPSARTFDASGAVLSGITFILLIMAIDSAGREVSPSWVALIVVAGAGMLVWLVRHQLSRDHPMLPVDLLRIPMLRLSVMTAASCYNVQSLCYVSLPFHFTHDLGLPTGWIGMVMAPWPLGVAIAAPLAGTLAERRSVALLGSSGLAVLACGLLLLVLLPADPSPLDIAWRMLVCGLGFGFFQTPNSLAIMSSAPAERSGGASAVQSAARLFGQTCGAALVAMILGLAAARGTTLAILCAIGFTLLAFTFSALRAFAAPRGEPGPQRG